MPGTFELCILDEFEYKVSSCEENDYSGITIDAIPAMSVLI